MELELRVRARSHHRDVLAVMRQHPPLRRGQLLRRKGQSIGIRLQQRDHRRRVVGQDQQVDILAVLQRDRAISERRQCNAFDDEHRIARAFDQPQQPRGLGRTRQVATNDAAGLVRDGGGDRGRRLDTRGQKRGMHQARDALAKYDLLEARPVIDPCRRRTHQLVAWRRGRPAATGSSEEQLGIVGCGHSVSVGCRRRRYGRRAGGSSVFVGER